MKKRKIQIREIRESQLQADLLASFERYQKVERVWRLIDGEKQIVPCVFTEEWDEELKREIVLGDFAEIMEFGGRVFLAYEKDRLLGFAVLSGEAMGPELEYLQLVQLQVSHPERGRGVGSILFENCARIAKLMGAKKLYISGHSSVETQAFYTKVGCVDAEWIFKEQAEREPYDIQLEVPLD